MLFFVNKYHVQHTNIDNKKKRSRQMDMRPEIYVGERIVRNNHKIEREKMMLSLRKKKLALPQRSLHIFSILSLKQISFFLFVLCFKKYIFWHDHEAKKEPHNTH